MTTAEYEVSLSNKLIRRFQEEYYKKIGVVPSVLIKSKTEVLPITMEELKDTINTYIPKDVRETFPCILLSTRHRAIVDLRKIFIHIAYFNLVERKINISRYLKQDHTTILHNLKVFDDLYSKDTKFSNLYLQIINHLNLLPYGTPDVQSIEEGGTDSEPTLHFMAHEESACL